jgi:hypothetical protein
MEIVVDDVTDLINTPAPNTAVDERPSVVDCPGEVTQTWKHTEYDSGAADAVRFMRAELIWRRGQRVTGEMIEQIAVSVMMAAKESQDALPPRVKK